MIEATYFEDNEENEEAEIKPTAPVDEDPVVEEDILIIGEDKVFPA